MKTWKGMYEMLSFLFIRLRILLEDAHQPLADGKVITWQTLINGIMHTR